MPFMSKPPPSSILLGRSISGEFTYWGTSEGQLVATSSRPTTIPEANVTPTHNRAADPIRNSDADPLPDEEPRAASGRERRREASPIRDLALTLLTVVGALAAMQLAATEPTFEPGEPSSSGAPIFDVPYHTTPLRWSDPLLPVS